jgi:Tol biopolymer transport system component
MRFLVLCVVVAMLLAWGQAFADSAVQITTHPANDYAPTWLPDGSMIAFHSNRSGNNDIWVIPATGGMAAQVTTYTGEDSHPDWSPDGSTIAFQSERNNPGGPTHVFTIPATGEPATEIAPRGGGGQPGPPMAARLRTMPISRGT